MGKKKSALITVAIIAAAAAAWAATDRLAGSDDGWAYLPWRYATDHTVSLGLMAPGPDVALDYFPGGYAVLPKEPALGVKRSITSFQIQDPAVRGDEAWPYDADLDITYGFFWTESNGDEFESYVPASALPSKTGWVEAMPKVKENARNKTQKSLERSGPDDMLGGTYLLVKTYFGGDFDYDGNLRGVPKPDGNGITVYSNISKKFAFRAPASQVARMGVARSDDPDTGRTLFTADGGRRVPKAGLAKANYATFHVQPGQTGKAAAFGALIPDALAGATIVTVDADNARIDSANAQPKLYNSYVDAFLVDSQKRYLGQAGEVVGTGSVFWRIAPYADEAQASAGISDSNGSIPGLPAWAGWTRGPSGSFSCKDHLPIGDPGWVTECNEGGDSEDATGLMQHYVPFPSGSGDRAALFQFRNVSHATAGNAFAIAASVDLWPTDPDVLTIDPSKPNPLQPEATGTTVSATTYVEVTMPAAVPERGFDDNGKDTASGATHTYKAEVCNGTPAAVQGVKVRLSLPELSSLVGEPGDSTGSSLMIDGSRLDDLPDASRVLDPALFGSDLPLGELAPGQCRYFTYQADVEPGSATGGVLSVRNSFAYGSGAVWSDTNEVVNNLASTISGSLILDSNPATGTKVQRGDYVEYVVTFQNGGTAPIPSGTVTCARMTEDDVSECLVGQCAKADFQALEPGADYQFTFSVRVKPEAAKDAVLGNACRADFSGESADSNATAHVVEVPSAAVAGGSFELELYARPKLINSPDGNPRPDGLDASPIRYTYRYSGSKSDNFYPKLSNSNGYSYGPVRCGPSSLPYYPNAFTYWGNSASTSPRGNPGVGSSPLTFSLATTLPSAVPKTVLKSGTLTPTHQVPGGELNSWFVDGGEKVLPIDSTVHRALVNGRDGTVSATISGTMQMDRWQYVPYALTSCSFVSSCGKRGCTYRSRTYSLYRWQLNSRTPVPFSASAARAVDVTGSTGWLRTRNGNVHTNNRFSQDGTSSNVYDLGQAGYEAVRSSPKSYTPPGSFHADYFVSSNAAGSNLTSRRGWYALRDLPFGHGDAYDRGKNPRDYYGDLLSRQKFGKVVKDGLPNPLKSFAPGLNEIWYWPGDLVIEAPSGTFIVGGRKATIVVGGNLRIKTDMAYAQPSGTVRSADLPYLGLVVKGDLTVDPGVTSTVGAWHVDGTLRTGAGAKRWKHLGQVAAGRVDLERKAPEFNEGETNAPSEDLIFDDQVYDTVPPGFAQLDDGRWAFFSNVNQFTGEVTGWWDQAE